MTIRLGCKIHNGWIYTVLTLAVFMAQAGCAGKITDSTIQFVSLTEVRDISAMATTLDGSPQDGTLLIDPRSRRLYDLGHIPGAVNILLTDVRTEGHQDPRLLDQKRIIVYGQSPGSAIARAMSKKLMAAKLGKVYMFAGGLDEWSRTGTVEVSDK